MSTASRVVACCIALLVVAGCATPGRVADRQGSPIEIQSIRLTAAGHYVDLRYRVLDPKAAQAALGPGVKPILTDEATGRTMAVPSTAKLGSLRQTQNAQRPDHTYFVLFINAAGLKPGSRVTADLGGMQFRHLKVQ